MGVLRNLVWLADAPWVGQRLIANVFHPLGQPGVPVPRNELNTDAFLAEQFSIRVRQENYFRLTAAFAKFFFSTGAGILYPSVEARNAWNIAVVPDVFDRHFEAMLSMILRIEQVRAPHERRSTIRCPE